MLPRGFSAIIFIIICRVDLIPYEDRHTISAVTTNNLPTNHGVTATDDINVIIYKNPDFCWNLFRLNPLNPGHFQLN